MSFRVNDFFCGAGGVGIGFKQAGFDIAGSWDINKHAITSYKHNVEKHAEQKDIKEMFGDELPDANVWTFGFPCTDLSVAGKKEGLIKGKNSGLFFQVMRLLGEVQAKPEFLLAENVKGLKHYLSVMKEYYDEAGYNLYYALYDSKNWGIPQKRQRYYVVGVRKDIDTGFTMPKEPTVQVPLESILEDSVAKEYIMDAATTKAIVSQALFKLDKLEGVHACLTPKRVNKRQQGRRAKPTNEEAFTLTAQDRHGIIDARGKKVIVRLLTPRESARLQGFPDTFEFVVSDAELYKQFGNAVSVPIAKGIAETMKNMMGGATGQEAK